MCSHWETGCLLNELSTMTWPNLEGRASEKAGMASKNMGVSLHLVGTVPTVRLLLACVNARNVIAAAYSCMALKEIVRLGKYVFHF